MSLTRSVVALCALASLALAQPTPVRRVTLDGRPVAYTVQGEYAVTQGDIILGTAAEIEAAALGKGPVPRAAAVLLGSNGQPLTWPDGIVYYTIAVSFPNQQRVLDAIDDWNRLTPIRIQLRTTQANYVQFTAVADSGTCQSFIGQVGGRQSIELGSGCPRSAIVHEIGHAVGMMHEQSRQDRNRWLTVLYENVDPLNFLQFEQFGSRDQGYYDYDSTMHYSPGGFSLDGNAAIETVPQGIPIGQRYGLSAADIDNVSRLYGVIPTQTTVTTIPIGLPILVDGERYTSPRAFSWSPGSAHTIAVDSRIDNGSLVTPTRNSFVRWTDGGALAHTFTAGASQTIVAAEFQQSFKVQTSVFAGNGTVSIEPPSADGYYLAGTKVRITATGTNGDKFYRWQGTNPENFGFGLAEEVLSMEVRGTLNFPGQFTNQFMTTVDSTPHGQEILVDGVPYYAPARFLSFTAGTTHTLSVTSPQPDWSDSVQGVFAGWEDGSLSASRTIQVGSTPPTYAANFTRQYYLYFDWNNGGSVNASPSTPDDFYDANARVAVTAVPRGNSALQYWLGDFTSGGNIQNIVMNRPKFLVAWFGSPLSFRATNAASYLSTTAFDQPGLAVAPLEIVTLLGTGLGPTSLTNGALDQNGRLSTVAGDTRILFDGVPAPIVYASAGQTSVIVPSEVAGKVFTVISVERAGTVTSVSTASITTALPGLFTANSSGTGSVAALNQDGSFHSTTRPAARGSVVTLFATGSGVMDRTLPNGAVTDGNLSRPLLPVSVRIGTQTAELLYAGSAPSLVHGVLQVNVRIPQDLLPGDHPIKLVVGNFTSPPGTIVSVR